jgi:hypothetical protein
MDVKYRISSNTVTANVISDITGIIGGTITQANQLSAGASGNTIFSGNYPSGTIYTVSFTDDATASVISKKNHANTSYQSYILLSGSTDTTFGVGINATACGLGKDWSSGSTITNSTTGFSDTVLHLKQYIPTADKPEELIIIVTNKSLILIQSNHNTCIGWVDITTNGVVEKYTTSMRTILCNFTTSNAKVPYTYKLLGALSSYGLTNYTKIFNAAPFTSTPDAPIISAISFLAFDENRTPVIIENPALVCNPNAGNYVNFLYGVVSIPPGLLKSKSLYNTSGVNRISFSNFAFVTE